MKTTLLIATRNRAEQLQYGLASIKARQYKNLDIKLIDDGSTDGTVDIVEKHYSDMLTVHRTNRTGKWNLNPSNVWNIGHKLASDSDIVIEQGGEVCHLTDCVTPMIEYCKPGVMVLTRCYNGTIDQMIRMRATINVNKVRPRKNILVDHVRTNGDRWAVPRVDGGIELYTGEERLAPLMFCGAIHRKDFEAVGGYDESLTKNNDGDLAERLQQRGVKFLFLGEAIAFHLRHGKS